MWYVTENLHLKLLELIESVLVNINSCEKYLAFQWLYVSLCSPASC